MPPAQGSSEYKELFLDFIDLILSLFTETGKDSVVYHGELLQPTVIKRESKAKLSIYLVSDDLSLPDKVNCGYYATDPAAKAKLLQEIGKLPAVACPDPEGKQEFSCSSCSLTGQCKR